MVIQYVYFRASKKLPVIGAYDVAVCGGVAGVAAALAMVDDLTMLDVLVLQNALHADGVPLYEAEL